jgi:hypothetical protein
MRRYVKLYADVLSKDICNEMIELFDRSENMHEDHTNDLMDFKQINLVKHADVWGKYVDVLSDVFLKGLEQYKHECEIQIPMQWPEKYGFEEFRLKRYEPNQGRFDLHTDVNDLNSAKRFLVFFIYLNSGEDGGTHFPLLNVVTPRKQGSLLMFPPLWTYPHAGLMPKQGRKYIIGSYLHYLRSEDESIRY